MGISSSARIPAGFIMPYGGGTPPAGFLECAGQAVSRSNFAALFLAISTVYGVGDGSTTFNIPDLRGRSMFGKDNMNGTAANRLTAAGGLDGLTLGAVGGGEAVTLTEAQMPSHAHVQNAHNHGQDAHGHGQDAHNHAQNAHSHTLTQTIGGGSSSISNGGVGSFSLASQTRTTDAPTATNQASTVNIHANTATNQAATATNQGNGSSAAHQNIPPAIVTFMMIKT